MSEKPPEETVRFVHGKLEFQVVLTETGELKVTLCGRGNGRMLIYPRSNVSVSCLSDRLTGKIES